MPVERFYLLDVLRGIAALIVVLFHYPQLWGGDGVPSPEFDPAGLPGYSLLWWFIYGYGAEAVLLFFTLSGFFFFALYREAVNERRMSAGRFAWLRFSRLYPLHFVTLLLVVLIQGTAHAVHGQFIGTARIDGKHFILQLFLASSWGFEDGHSFNVPIWSVSIEVLLYAVFFVFAQRFRSIGAVLAACGLALALYAVVRRSHPLPLTLFCFFLGGAVQYVHVWLRSWGRAGLGLAWVGLLLSLAVYVGLENSRFSVHRLTVLMPLCAGVFPALILLGALLQDGGAERGRSLRWVGDITYSTYLLHYPLNLCLHFVQRLGLTLDFSSSGLLIGYLATVVLLSLLTYYRFEVPAQAFLRRQLRSGGRRPLAEAA